MENGKQRIINAAARIFAQKGYGAASIANIAIAAGTSKASVFHHFENKENLYRRVLLETFESVSSIWGSATEQGTGDFHRDLEILTAKTLEFQSEHTDTVSLLIREVLDSKNEKLSIINSPITQLYFEKMTQSVIQIAHASSYKKTINPNEIVLSILSHALFHFVFGGALKNIKGLEFLNNTKDLSAWLVNGRLIK